MSIDMNKVRPLRADVLIRRSKIQQQRQSSILYVPEEDRDLNAANFYEVIAVGPDVKEIKPGDTILVVYAGHTPPVEVNGEKYAVVEEKDILAIVE